MRHFILTIAFATLLFACGQNKDKFSGKWENKYVQYGEQRSFYLDVTKLDGKAYRIVFTNSHVEDINQSFVATLNDNILEINPNNKIVLTNNKLIFRNAEYEKIPSK